MYANLIKVITYAYKSVFMILLLVNCKPTEIKSADNSILSVSIPNIPYSAIISPDTIFITVDKYQNITSLSPVIEIAPYASVEPKSETVQDYTKPITYVVTAEDGSIKRYVMTVIPKKLSSQKEIVEFYFSSKNYRAIKTDEGFHFDFYDFTDIFAISPIIEVSEFASILPASGQEINLSNPVKYTITAEDGSNATCMVTASKHLSHNNDIVEFALLGTEQRVEIIDTNIYIYTPYETDVRTIATTIKISDHATVFPESGAKVNMSIPRTYTVVSSDGKSKDYLVTVKKSPWKCLLQNGVAPFAKVDGHRIIEFNGSLYVIGGWLGSNKPAGTPNDVWTSQVFRTQDGVNWENVGDAPWVGRHGFGCVVHANKLWVLGGDNHLDVWNTSDGKVWQKVIDAVPWGARYFPYITVFNNQIWVISGQQCIDGDYSMYSDIWSSTDGINWNKQVDIIPFVARGLISGSVVLNNELYIIAGGVLSNVGPRAMEYNDVWKTADGRNWQLVTKEAPFAPVIWHSIGVYGSKMYLTTGCKRGDIHSNELWWSNDGRDWTQAKYNFWAPRHAASLASFKGKLYMIGGTIDPIRMKDTQNDVWVMDSEF